MHGTVAILIDDETYHYEQYDLREKDDYQTLTFTGAKRALHTIIDCNGSQSPVHILR